MSSDTNSNARRRLGRWLSIGIVITAVTLGVVVLYRTNHYPRTDDAEVLANLIGIAPQVEGPIIRLHARDNQFVKQGDLLFEIDERPYQYALERAISEQAALEGQIEDERRKIASQVSAVDVAKASVQGSKSDIDRYSAAIDQARADVTNAEQGVTRAQAEWEYSNNNLRRIEPLLVKQFVTVDQVDKARSSEVVQKEVLKQAESKLRLAQAGLRLAEAQHEQSRHAVTTLEPLVNQRGAKASAIETARYNLNNCRVYAPFDARVTSLTISEGAFAHVGQQIFTLIDARTWWTVANFREGQLQNITPGLRADVYVMSQPNVRFSGVVDSVGFGVTPDADVIGSLKGDLPDIQRTLNWVHLASRYPVRVRVEDPPPDLFRVGQSAVVIIRKH